MYNDMPDLTCNVIISTFSTNHTFISAEAAEWSGGRMPVCCAEGRGPNPGWGAQEFSILSFVFHQ